MTRPGEQRVYIRKWKDANPRPWICSFCSKKIDHLLPSRSKRALVVHHIDEDRTNNALSNLAGAHADCHSRHHAHQREYTEAHKQNTGRARSAAWARMTDEERRALSAKLSASRKGRPWSASRRAAHERRKIST